MAPPDFQTATVFEAGTHGYFNYRIPALVRTTRGTLVAFVEARKGSGGDWDPSAIFARRCVDPVHHLDAWEKPFVVKKSDRLVTPRSWGEIMFAGRYAEEMDWDQEAEDFEPKVPVCTNNPVPIVDQDGKTLHLVYCDHYDRAYYARSTDDGVTWGGSTEITPVLEEFRDEYAWSVIAAGPGHGLQLELGACRGRLIVPFWFAANDAPGMHWPSQVGIIYSDDHGASWQRGGMVPFSIKDPNESLVVELSDGSLLLNARSKAALSREDAPRVRHTSTSTDGGITWTPYRPEPALPEPICMAGFIQVSPPAGTLTNRKSHTLAFTGPNCLNHPGASSQNRQNLTIWLSPDDGQTWPVSRTIEPGFAGYSDLAVDPGAAWIYCLYEQGAIGGSPGRPESIQITRFTPDWVRIGNEEGSNGKS